MWYDQILGAFSTPNSTAANSSLNGAASSNGSSVGSFLSGLVNLGTQGANAYATVANAGHGSGSSSSTATNTTGVSSIPWITIAIVGGLVGLIFLLFKRGG